MNPVRRASVKRGLPRPGQENGTVGSEHAPHAALEADWLP